MSLRQITKIEGRIDRVKPDQEPPVIELQLDDHQRVVTAKLEPILLWDPTERKTRDWTYTVYVEATL